LLGHREANTPLTGLRPLARPEPAKSSAIWAQHSTALPFMGQAKRRKQQLGPLYGTPEGSNRKSGDIWAQIERMQEYVDKWIFEVGQTWLSPGNYHFEVVQVLPKGRAVMQKLGPGWIRAVEIDSHSPSFHRWKLLDLGEIDSPAHQEQANA
jgi:hypothetical protein